MANIALKSLMYFLSISRYSFSLRAYSFSPSVISFIFISFSFSSISALSLCSYYSIVAILSSQSSLSYLVRFDWSLSSATNLTRSSSRDFIFVFKSYTSLSLVECIFETSDLWPSFYDWCCWNIFASRFFSSLFASTCISSVDVTSLSMSPT